MAPPTNRDSDKFMLRLPDGLREAIKSKAAENGRSMNSEIVLRLKDSLVQEIINKERFSNADEAYKWPEIEELNEQDEIELALHSLENRLLDEAAAVAALLDTYRSRTKAP